MGMMNLSTSQTAWSSSALTVHMEASMLAQNMGHDTTDSLHVVAVVLLAAPGSYPSAEAYLSDVKRDTDQAWAERTLKRAFVSFDKLPGRRYQTPAYQRTMKLAEAFAETHRQGSLDSDVPVTVGDLIAAARMSGSLQLDRLLPPDYNLIMERVLDRG